MFPSSAGKFTQSLCIIIGIVLTTWPQGITQQEGTFVALEYLANVFKAGLERVLLMVK